MANGSQSKADQFWNLSLWSSTTMPPTPSEPFEVLLTGFGPWGDIHNDMNPSWEAVKLLTDEVLSNQPSNLINDSIATRSVSSSSDIPIHITTKKISVSYETVLKEVPAFQHLPPSSSSLMDSIDSSVSQPSISKSYDLIVHVGVGESGAVKLEGLARKFTYDKLDVDSKLPPGSLGHRGYLGSEWAGSKEILYTKLNRKKILKFCHSKGIESIAKSEDAGLYLCEFIYYCTLACARRVVEESGNDSRESEMPCLFVHVPSVNMPYTIAQLAQILRLIIWGIVNEGGLEEQDV